MDGKIINQIIKEKHNNVGFLKDSELSVNESINLLQKYYDLCGKNIIKATKKQDIEEHWDFKINLQIDAKGIKHIKRNDKEVNENYHWVELKNVEGKIGWLYGEADMFSFEIEDYVVYVNKYKLQEFIAEKCRDKISCTTPTLYQIYNRKGRQDKITLVKTIDLMYLADLILKKE